MKELTHEEISFDWEKILQEAHPETQTSGIHHRSTPRA
jgi:hypothetical protein